MTEMCEFFRRIFCFILTDTRFLDYDYIHEMDY